MHAVGGMPMLASSAALGCSTPIVGWQGKPSQLQKICIAPCFLLQRFVQAGHAVQVGCGLIPT